MALSKTRRSLPFKVTSSKWPPISNQRPAKVISLVLQCLSEGFEDFASNWWETFQNSQEIFSGAQFYVIILQGFTILASVGDIVCPCTITTPFALPQSAEKTPSRQLHLFEARLSADLRSLWSRGYRSPWWLHWQALWRLRMQCPKYWYWCCHEAPWGTIESIPHNPAPNPGVSRTKAVWCTRAVRRNGGRWCLASGW